MILKRVAQPGTLEKIRQWIVESRAPGSVVNMSGRYYVLVDNETHVAAAGLKRLSWLLTELKHVVVAPEFRRRGYGRAVVRLALEKAQTPVVIATVREDVPWWQRAMELEDFDEVCRVETPRGAIHLLWT